MLAFQFHRRLSGGSEEPNQVREVITPTPLRALSLGESGARIPHAGISEGVVEQPRTALTVGRASQRHGDGSSADKVLDLDGVMV
jgi:hypothetical protein